MGTLTVLNDLVGGQVLGDHLSAAVHALAEREQISAGAAYQHVTDAADRGDPATLAATRQTWERRATVDPAQAPARSLYVIERTLTGVFAVPLDAEGEGSTATAVPAQGRDLPIDTLAFYRLVAWDPFEHLLPTSASLTNVRPATGKSRRADRRP